MMSNKVKIISYSNNSIILSNKNSILGSTIITDEGVHTKVDILNDEEKFLGDINNYSFLNNYQSKEIFIVGCGSRFIIPSINVKKIIYDFGFKLEWSITSSALQTFNMIIEDSRSCIALLINTGK